RTRTQARALRRKIRRAALDVALDVWESKAFKVHKARLDNKSARLTRMPARTLTPAARTSGDVWGGAENRAKARTSPKLRRQLVRNNNHLSFTAAPEETGAV